MKVERQAWKEGRQGSGYFKRPLIVSKRFKFDSYLLKFPVGSEIGLHKDTANEGRHFRLNIILRQSRIGGEFICSETLLDWPRIKLFRPDLQEHAVTKVEDRSRYVLSIGWLRP